MVIGIFTDDFYPHIGGIRRHVFEIARRLPQEQTVVFSPCENKIINHVKVKTPLHTTLKNLGLSLWLHLNLDRLVIKYNLTTIHIHCGPGGLFLIRKLCVPVVATCHHTYWQQSHYIKSQIWKRVFIPFEKCTYQLAERIICVSENGKRILLDKYHMRQYKVVVIPNGVDAEKFRPFDKARKVPKSLLYVGRP